MVMQQQRRQGRSVDLVWVPSHIVIPGNEAPDEAASESLLQRVLLPRVTIKVAPMNSGLRVPSVIEGDKQRSRGF